MSNYEEFIQKLEIMKSQRETIERVNKTLLELQHQFARIDRQIHPPRFVWGMTSSELEEKTKQSRLKHHERLMEQVRRENMKQREKDTEHEQHP